MPRTKLPQGSVPVTLRLPRQIHNRLAAKARRAEQSLTDNNTVRTVAYTYDDDGNRQTIQYPGGATFAYDYTARNQLWENPAQRIE